MRAHHRTLGAALLLAMVLLSGWAAWQHGSGRTEVRFIDLQGRPIELHSLRGKVVLVNFWSTSCAPCLKEMPQWVALRRQFSEQQLAIIAVAMRYDAPNYVLDYVRQNPLPFPVALDPQGQVAHAMGGVEVVPTTFFIRTNGQSGARITGMPDFARLERQVRQALTE